MEEELLLSVEQINSVPTQRNFTGVKIREFDDSLANPEPIKQEEDTDQLLEEFLSANKLVSFHYSNLWLLYWPVSDDLKSRV